MISRITPLMVKDKDKFITVYTVKEIQKILTDLQNGSVIFLDVDDTLITPQSSFFRFNSPYRTFIDDIKKQREKISNFEMILSHWRLQRKIMLVSTEWPDFIKALQKSYAVYALTKLETGRLGAIPSMEKWRYKELTKCGINFTPTCPGIRNGIFIETAANFNPSAFYKGIFITGSFRKSDVIAAFLKCNRPTQIVLIDDRLEHLEDATGECKRQCIPFLGILFKGIELLPGEPDPKIAVFQRQYLLDHAQWIEDEQARLAMDVL